MTYRKTLEVALRTAFDIEGGGLASIMSRVSELEPALFTLFAWLARRAGNEAAHEMEFSREATLLMDSNVEQLVVHLFTVPEMKARARAASSAAGKSP